MLNNGNICLILLSLLSATTSGRVSNGTCPRYEIQENFSIEKYAGKWYEQVRDKDNKHTVNSDCVTKEFWKSGDHYELNFRAFYNKNE